MECCFQEKLLIAKVYRADQKDRRTERQITRHKTNHTPQSESRITGEQMTQYIRSRELIPPEQSFVIVIDVQEKLVAAIDQSERLIDSIARLLESARLFHVPITGTEQYPQGLGKTVSLLGDYLDHPCEKKRFSCVESLQLSAAGEREDGRFRAVLVGIEAHVCVQQTAFDLQSLGYEVIIPVDAVRSRHELDCSTALRRLENSGTTLTTIESLMFEWCATAEDPHFKAVSKIVTGRKQ